MTAMPQPGDYQQTGLPMQPDVFKAWLFLQAHSDAQPPSYRTGITTTLAKTLYDLGEHKPDLLVAALLSVMSPSILPTITRRIGEECAVTIAAFSQQAIARFAYIDLASTAVQKITMAMMCATMEQMRQKGEEMLADLQAIENREGDTINITLPMLPDERSFMLIYDKIADTTGNQQLENVYLDTVLEYAAFRLDYLRQLSNMRILPPQTLQGIARQLEDSGYIPPVFEATGLPETTQMRAIYTQLSTDPRVKPDTLKNAVDIAAVLTDSDESSHTTIAAALLGNALPHLGKLDHQYLRDIAGEDVLATIEDNNDAIVSDVPMGTSPLSLRHISVAQAIVALREGTTSLTTMRAHLSSDDARSLPPEARRRYASQAIQGVGILLQDVVVGLQPQASSMRAPKLAETLDETILATYDALSRLREFAVPQNSNDKKSPRPGF